VTVADGTFGQIYELDDVFIGGETGATGLADGANTAQYGGEVSEHALDGVIDPGTCKTGYLPFQGGVGVPYLQWGDNPLAPDATWWALYPGTPVVPTAGACSPSPAEMQGIAESLVPPNSSATLSLQGMPSTGEIDGWDHTLCQWTIYADGKTTFREAETFWDDALATLGATVTKTSTAPLILDYDFFTPDGSISATFTELADGSTDADIDIYVTGPPSVPQGAVRLRATSSALTDSAQADSSEAT
jgi:hypothetical protein